MSKEKSDEKLLLQQQEKLAGIDQQANQTIPAEFADRDAAQAQAAGSPAPTTPVNQEALAFADGKQNPTTTPQQPIVATPTPGQPQQTATPPANAAGTTTETPVENNGVQPADYTFTGAQLAQMGPAVEGPSYLADWANAKNIYEEAKRLNVPILQVLQDYWKWGHDTGNPTNWVDGWFQDMDLRKSVADNEEEKKKQERKERWDKVSNFLSHLGNVIGNVASSGYGSVKLEDPVQWTERQRLLKEKGLEQRRLNNQSLLTQLNRERENQRAYELKKQQAEANAAYRQAQADAAAERAKTNAMLAEVTANLRNAQTEKTKQLTPLQADTEKSKAEKNRRPSSGRRTTGKQDSQTHTTYTRNSEGQVTESTRTTRYGNTSSKTNSSASAKQTAQQREAAKKKWASKKTKK